MNPLASVADAESPLDATTTSAGPAAPAGVTAVSCAPDTMVSDVAAAPPTVTESTPPEVANCWPVMVSVVPPAVDPETGLNDSMRSGGTGGSSGRESQSQPGTSAAAAAATANASGRRTACRMLALR